MDRSAKRFVILPAIFCFIGVGLLAPAIWFGYQSWAFLQAAEVAQGMVIGLDWIDDSGTSAARPVVSYEVRGEPYQITGSVSSYPPAYHIGESARVLYSPGQPRSERLESWLDFWFLPLLFGGIGLVFGLIGGGLWYLFSRTMS
jgi:hypothetical protein